MMLKREQSQVIVTFTGMFNVETDQKWHIMPLMEINNSGLEIRKWVGRCLEVLLEEEGFFVCVRMYVCVCVCVCVCVYVYRMSYRL